MQIKIHDPDEWMDKKSITKFEILLLYFKEILNSNRTPEEQLDIINKMSSNIGKVKNSPLWFKGIQLEFSVDDCYEDIDPDYAKTDVYPKIKQILSSHLLERK